MMHAVGVCTVVPFDKVRVERDAFAEVGLEGVDVDEREAG